MLLTSLLVSAGNASADPGYDPYDVLAAETFVDKYVSRQGLPGAVSAATKLPVGSVSKSFTAFAVLQLVEKGQVALDAPITGYLSTFAVRGTDPAAITVRLLLDHTPGLPNPPLVYPTGSLQGDVAAVSGLFADSIPGQKYGYSNLAIALLGVRGVRRSWAWAQRRRHHLL